MVPRADWSYPTTVRLGAGRLSELAHACRMAGIERPLLVTDAGLAGLPVTQHALDRLDGGGLRPAIFADVRPNPDDANLAAGVRAFRDGAHDGVVAFGGGSALDLGKLVAFMVGQSRPVWDFEDVDDWWTLADPLTIRPVVAVPTTAGTGSEVGRAGVLTDRVSHAKKVIFHPKMLPVVAILDPELTVSMPAAITVGTGMDAFAHCLEAYCAPAYHPMSHGIALEGLKLVTENLPRVVAEPADVLARAHMMTAAAMGAVAFQKGLGAIHALSHPIGALYDTHHGMTNACVMPAVLRFNRPAIEPQIEALTTYLGMAGGFDGFFEFTLALRAELGVPTTLSALGVDGDRIDEMAAMAVADPTAGGNPIPLDIASAKSLFAQCL